MINRKIYFRADASQIIGYGHFIRTLALADMLKDNFDCTFFTQSPTDYQIAEVNRVCKLVSLPSDNSKFSIFLDCLKGDEIVVLDNYFFSSYYQLQITNKGCKLVCIDDMHDRHYHADVVINHALSDTTLFNIEPYTKLCLGLQWALLRKPFLSKGNATKQKNHWFVSFGGSDINNLTNRFLCYLQRDDRVKSIVVVVGDAYKNIDSIHESSKTIILKNLTAEQMAFEMSRAEYAVLPNSGVSIEALACGCKIAAGYYAENQILIADEWKKNNYIVSLGDLNEYHSDAFIGELINSTSNYTTDFSKVPDNYINLFTSL